MKTNFIKLFLKAGGHDVEKGYFFYKKTLTNIMYITYITAL